MPVSCGELSGAGVAGAPEPQSQAGGGGASCSKGEMILSSKQEMVTRRPGAALNDLQLSSQKRKKKKFSNNRQIVAGLPEGKSGSWGRVRGGHQCAEGLLCPRSLGGVQLSTVGAGTWGDEELFSHTPRGVGLMATPSRHLTGVHRTLLTAGVKSQAHAPLAHRPWSKALALSDPWTF